MEKETSDNKIINRYRHLWLQEEATLRPTGDPVQRCLRHDALLQHRRRLLVPCLVLALALAAFTPVCAASTAMLHTKNMQHPTDTIDKILLSL